MAILVIANADLRTPERVHRVLDFTGADGLMMGRGAQGRPWLFREVSHYLAHRQLPPPPRAGEVRGVVVHHLRDLDAFYGPLRGVRIGRRHIAWYLASRPDESSWKKKIYNAESLAEQLSRIESYFDLLQGRAIPAA